MNYAHRHSEKIKKLSTVIFIINLILSFVAGEICKVANVRNSYYNIIEYSYNWILVIILITISIVLYIIFYVLVVNIVEAIEDITLVMDKATDRIVRNLNNFEKTTKESFEDKLNDSENEENKDDKESKEDIDKEDYLESWMCPLCGRLNDCNKNGCDCGYNR